MHVGSGVCVKDGTQAVRVLAQITVMHVESCVQDDTRMAHKLYVCLHESLCVCLHESRFTRQCTKLTAQAHLIDLIEVRFMMCDIEVD